MNRIMDLSKCHKTIKYIITLLIIRVHNKLASLYSSEDKEESAESAVKT